MTYTYDLDGKNPVLLSDEPIVNVYCDDKYLYGTEAISWGQQDRFHIYDFAWNKQDEILFADMMQEGRNLISRTLIPMPGDRMLLCTFYDGGDGGHALYWLERAGIGSGELHLHEIAHYAELDFS